MKKYQKNAFLKMSVFTEYNLIITDPFIYGSGGVVPERCPLLCPESGEAILIPQPLSYSYYLMPQI